MKREAPLSHKLDDPFEELGGDMKRPGFVVWAVYCERKFSPIVRRTNLRTSLVTEAGSPLPASAFRFEPDELRIP
ncbi:hypothetical protein MRX96_029936 [Rhipicephalus microplus]